MGTYYHTQLADGTPHHHRAVLSFRLTRPFIQCRNPTRCTAAAHGDLEIEDRCRCGSVRLTNRRGLAKEYGPWTPVPDQPPTPEQLALVDVSAGNTTP